MGEALEWTKCQSCVYGNTLHSIKIKIVCCLKKLAQKKYLPWKGFGQCSIGHARLL